jgi:dTDP-4-dehydrorhamnose reductase
VRVLVTGGAGLLGARLVADAPDGVEVHATWHRTAPPDADVGWHQVDLADAEATRGLCDRIRPDVVVHTAYATADGHRAIVEATSNVADAVAATGAALVHLSSDVVFDGEHAPYDEGAPPLPISEYGRHKAEAEAVVARRCPAATIVRTSLITWSQPLDPRSAWVVDALRAGDPLTLFTDEIRCPVRLDDLSAQLWELARSPTGAGAGLWHLVGSESLSRFDLGVLIAEHAGLDAGGIEGRSSRGQRPARPRDLRLTAQRSAALLTTPARSVRSLFPLTNG